MRYPILSSPLTVGGLTLRNRIVVPPISDFGLTQADLHVNPRHVAHYGGFAAGGAGLVIVEACEVSPIPDPERDALILWDDSAIPGLRAVSDAIHAGGAAAFVQLLHPGLNALRLEGFDALRESHLSRWREDFAAAALRAKEAGFDGVELHAAHGYFLNQSFELSRGTAEERAQYLLSVLRRVKEVCGTQYPVAVRFGAGCGEDLVTLAVLLEQSGADLLDVSTGIGKNWNVPSSFPYNRKVWMASRVKPHVSVPVAAVGRIFSGETAEGILQSGYADLVDVGRGHLCDPAWANKVLSGISPNPCRMCKSCLWYRDGRLCPARAQE